MFEVESKTMEEPEVETEELFKTSIHSSSEEFLSTEYSTGYQAEEGAKMKLYKEGLYSPGSGEICAKYIPMSRSSMINHVYYAYPSIKDPGIDKALLKPEQDKVYDVDGQDLYLDLCKQMNTVPMRSFHRDLKKEFVNLRYYGVNPVGIRAMCLALAYNQTVKRLDLTSNYLDNPDACYHLGQMLGDRNALTELIMDTCNIGPEGVRKLVLYLDLRKMKLLDLSVNNIQDVGLEHLANKILKGAVIDKLSLRRNHLTSDGLFMLANAFECNNSIKYLDLSWNMFMNQKASAVFCRELSNSRSLVELNLSWTSLNIVVELRDLLGILTLKVLKLNNNLLGTLAARTIGRSLHLATGLVKLDLSANPFSPADAYYVLVRMKHEKIKLRVLLMNFITVSKEFVQELEEILKLDFRKKTKITHGDVLRNYSIQEFDIKFITMRRLVVNLQKKKKSKLDILLYLMEVNKTRKFLDPAELIRTLKQHSCPVKEQYISDIVMLFPGQKNQEGKRMIDLNGVVDYIHRLWPEKKLPPTPPPTPPPEPKSPAANKKGKGKIKKK